MKLLILLAVLLIVRAFPETDPKRYIITFRGSDRTLEDATTFLAQFNSSLIQHLPLVNGAAVRIPTDAFDVLRTNAAVHILEPDVPRWIMSNKNMTAAKQNTPWGITRVNALNVADAGLANSKKVCVIDSGYDLGHEDLFSDSRVDGQHDWHVDGCGHGTHVAGTIAAVDNDIGVLGVGQTLPMFIIKVFGNDCGWAYASDLIAAADECNKQGATVISMSLGCASFLPSLCRSSAEEDGFNNLDAAGVLSIAAAGNAGNTWQSFPASYSSVVSVAATTSTDDVAAFSQRNAQVELAAPGSSVESTVPMGTGQSDTTTIDGTEYNTLSMEGSFLGTASGALVDCGDGSATCTNANGKICLIERGTVSFEEKSVNCEKGGGVGAILFNNEPGLFAGTLGDLVHFKLVVVSMSQEDGQAIKALLASRSITGTLESVVSNYEYYDGTSMATPHVSGVAAKIWSQVPSATNAQVRKALQEAARIPGSPAGTRDTSYGYGIIDAEASLVALQKIVQVESMGIMA